MSRSAGSIIRRLAVLVGLAAGALVAVPAAPAAANVPAALVISSDFPDPDVLVDNGRYYAYATESGGRHIQLATAGSAHGPWAVSSSDMLPTLAAWQYSGGATADTWAPDVSHTSAGYLMYYAAPFRSDGTHCIGTATSSVPTGPFTPRASALVCDATTVSKGGAIDPASFVDVDGARYLLYKVDGNRISSASTPLMLQRVTADGLSLVGAPVQLLDRSDADGPDIEAPALVHVGTHYQLFFSSNMYDTRWYDVSYATATSLTGPYTKAYRPLVTTDSTDGNVQGPGGADPVSGPDGVHLIFHGILSYPPALKRGMYVADMGWANDYPVVRGSRVRYEGENYYALNNAVIRDNAAGASGGKVVAKIDYSDSYVTLRVFAPSGGSYNVWVGYANGSPATAYHSVTVNGSAAGTVSYPVTGWDNWHQALKGVTLSAGWNTIRFTHNTWYAELDYIEVA